VNLELVPAGSNPPTSINVVIEVPIGGEPVKYELDKTSGAIFVDRILHTAMRYPANYGFIPHTLGEDGDPLDCLVMARWPFMPGCVVRARPIAVLFLEDEAGGDEKLLAVPEVKTSPYYQDVSEGEHLPPIVLDQISHFFTHYKDLEPEKWTRVGHWGCRDDALKVIADGLERARNVTFQSPDATIGEGRAVEA
jgi:inorganic pyrophosphatase